MTRAANKAKGPVRKPDQSDVVRRALDAAPDDDEPLSASDRRAIARARRGPYVSTDEVRRRLAR